MEFDENCTINDPSLKEIEYMWPAGTCAIQWETVLLELMKEGLVGIVQ